MLELEETPLSTSDRTKIAQEVADEILGHGPLEPFLRDPDVTEIMVNGPEQIYVERFGRIFPVDASFASDVHLRRTIDKIVGRVGRRVDEASPMVDARLQDGSRVNAVIAPIALDGAMLTIRKFAADPYTADDLVGFGTLTQSVRDLLDACVRGRLNILISGGTGSGKTTTLNVLSGFIPDDERIVTIEDAAELQLKQRHVLRLESRPPNIEGRGQVAIREPRPQRAADAAGPHRGRRGPRRCGPGHAAGDEHRARRLASRPCTPTRRGTRSPGSRRWC